MMKNLLGHLKSILVFTIIILNLFILSSIAIASDRQEPPIMNKSIIRFNFSID